MSISKKVKSIASSAKSTIAHIANKATPAVAKPTLNKIETKVKEEIKKHPNASLVALAVVNPVAAAGVLAVQHKDEVKSTLSKIGAEVKKDVEIVKTGTIKAVHTVEKVGKSAVSGFFNIYMYGMVALGGIILLKFL